MAPVRGAPMDGPAAMAGFASKYKAAASAKQVLDEGFILNSIDAVASAYIVYVSLTCHGSRSSNSPFAW
ncbi:MAG: hypothetical protein JWL62_335 [Hyphomicrobiales bacterium]|nr:hypothetical protein [Hyphomicrobiales bacterium]